MDANRINLNGRVAIVTGAGRGMGEVTARLLAARGAKVVLADIDVQTVEAVAASIRDEGFDAMATIVNVADESSVANMVGFAVERYGRLDCAVNNAALAPDHAMVAEADMDFFDRVISVNLRGVMLCMKYEIAQLLKQGSHGSIVNIGSVSSVRPQPKNAAYTAAKHGVVGLTKVGSLEYAGKGIRVNAVLPGSILTPMLEGAMELRNMKEEDYAPTLSLFGRWGQPQEVAEASAWLCSDAASFVTGHSLAVDAGYLTR